MIDITSALPGKFVWWIGVIEDRNDPLKLYRCRVRIFGVHTDNKSLLPTEDLPWAQAIQPMSGSSSISTPKIGDWVLGFFLDGDNAQFPMMLGIVPGIVQDTSNITNSGSSTNIKPSK